MGENSVVFENTEIFVPFDFDFNTNTTQFMQGI